MYACQIRVVTKEHVQPMGTITLVNARTISLEKAARLLGEASVSFQTKISKVLCKFYPAKMKLNHM